MMISSKVVSLLLAAGLAVTPSEANNGVGQGSMYGSGRSNFDGNAQGLYADPTRESFGQDTGPIQNSISEEQNTLPPGWTEHFDQSSGQYYYYNSLDGTTTWNRPLPAFEEPSLDISAQEGIERAEMQASDFTAVSERNADSSQEDQKNKDSPFSHQQSRDSQDPVMSKGQLTEKNSVKSLPTNRESQRADNFSPIGQATDDADGQRWAQRHVTSEQVENRESLQLSNGPKANTAGVLSEQGVPRDPEIIPNISNGINDPAESQENESRQGNTFPISDRVVGETAPEQTQIGGWGLPTQGTEALRRGTASQPSSPAFVQRENYADAIPQYSDSGRASGLPESRQIASPDNFRTLSRVPIHDQPNSAHQNHIQPPDRPSQASSAEREQRQQFVSGNSASNGQSSTQHRQPVFGNGDPRFNAPPRSHPPNPAYDSRSGGPQPPVPQPQSQNSQQRSNAMPQQAQYQHPQYQQSQGNPRPSPQYTNYDTQQQGYNQQPRISDTVTSVLEDGTEGVKEVLGKSWHGLVGFSSRTREAMGQARDQVVTGASVAGQSISEKSTNWWGQAKSAFGSAFEKGNETTPPQYNMSGQYGGQPPQKYPEKPNTQSYQGQNPTTFGPQGGRAQMPNSRQHERQRPQDQRNFQRQQHQPQNGQMRGPRPQPRYDPPLPQQGQARPPSQPYQNQYQHPPRPPNYTDQQGRQADRRPQQLSQDQHPDPWSHPGLSGDV